MHFRSRKSARSSSTSSSSASNIAIPDKPVIPAMEKENATVITLNVDNSLSISESSLSCLSSSSSAQPHPTKLIRCHSDTSQRNICSNVNPNTISTTANLHHHGALSNSQKITKLQELNSTLVKEVSSLRASQATMEASISALQIQLQASTFCTESLRLENKELEETVEHVSADMKSKTSSLLASEERLQTMVKKLENTNHCLSEEACRLKEETEVLAKEKNHLMEEVESLLREKMVLEDLVDSFRLGEEALRKELTQTIATADRQRIHLEEEREIFQKVNEKLREDKISIETEVHGVKTELCESRNQINAMKSEKIQLENANKMLCQEIAKIRADKACVEKQADELKSEKHYLYEENKSLQEALHQAKMVSSEYECQKDISTKEALNLNVELASALKINEELRSRSVSLHMELSISRGVAAHLQDELKRLNNELCQSLECTAEVEIKKNKCMVRIRELESELVLAMSAKDSLQSTVHATEKQFIAAKDEFSHTEKKLTEKIQKLDNDLAESLKKELLLKDAICTLKGELLVAEEEGERTREEGKAMVEMQVQKINALESKLLIMEEKQAEMIVVMEVNKQTQRTVSVAMKKMAAAQDDLSACLNLEVKEKKALLLKGIGNGTNINNGKTKNKKNSRSKTKAIQLKVPITVT